MRRIINKLTGKAVEVPSPSFASDSTGSSTSSASSASSGSFSVPADAPNKRITTHEPIVAEDLKTPVKPTWCPGCGDYSIWFAVKNALQKLNVPLENILMVYGIGCHGHMCNSVHTYGFEGLHGRPIPVAEGAKLANDKLKVIVIAGDGDTYGEGLNHFLMGLRGNHDVTLIVHNNMIYGLTTGQTSPTSEKGFTSKSTPEGVIEVPINPLSIGISAGGSFISRGFVGDPQQLTELIVKAVEHDGFALVDVLQNCVSFNKINTLSWFKERVYKLEDERHDSSDKMKALEKAFEFGPKIPTGIFYQDTRKSYEDYLPVLDKKPLLEHSPYTVDLTETFREFV